MPPTKPRTIADLPTRHYVEDGVDMGKSLIKREDVQDLLRTLIRELDEENVQQYERYKTAVRIKDYAEIQSALWCMQRAMSARDFAVKLLGTEKGEKDG